MQRIQQYFAKFNTADNPYFVSLVILFGVAFAMLFDLSIIMPTGALYMTRLDDHVVLTKDTTPSDHGNFYFGLAMVFFSLCQAIGNLGVGYCAKILGMRNTFMILLSLATIGNGMYGIGWNVWFALAGRAVAGFGSCCLGLVLGYIALVTTPAQRLDYMGYFRIVSNLGLIVAPGTSVILVFVKIKLSSSYTLDQYNSPGWATALLCLVLLILTAAFVRNPSRQDLAKLEATKKKADFFMSRGVATVLFCGFFNGIFGTSYEYMLAPVTQTLYGFQPYQTGLLIIGISVVSIFAVVILSYLQKIEWLKDIGERFWQLYGYIGMIMGLFFCQVGTTSLIPVPTWLGATLFCVGAIVAMDWWMILTVTLNPMYSKIIPPDSRIVMMPLQPAAGSFGRIFGPLIAATIMLQLKDWSIVLFVYLGILCLLCMGMVLLNWNFIHSNIWRQFVSDDEAVSLMGGSQEMPHVSSKHIDNTGFAEKELKYEAEFGNFH